MGVKGLGKILETYAKPCLRIKEFKDYCNGGVYAVDAAITFYRFGYALPAIKFKTTSGETITHLFALFFKTSSMLRYGHYDYLVFDGIPPEIKLNTLMNDAN